MKNYELKNGFLQKKESKVIQNTLGISLMILITAVLVRLGM